MKRLRMKVAVFVRADQKPPAWAIRAAREIYAAIFNQYDTCGAAEVAGIIERCHREGCLTQGAAVPGGMEK